jgi:hypothetical protein
MLAWERQENESALAFGVYRDYGSERSLAKVGRALGKSRALIERWSVQRCRNRRSHPAAALEYQATRLFEDNASHDALVDLYERAVRQEEERLSLGDPAAARRTHERLSGEMEALNAERLGHLRQ